MDGLLVRNGPFRGKIAVGRAERQETEAGSGDGAAPGVSDLVGWSWGLSGIQFACPGVSPRQSLRWVAKASNGQAFRYMSYLR